MNAALSEEQQLLYRTSGEVADDLGCPRPPQLPSTTDDAAGWRTLSTSGFLGMHLPDSVGGGSAASADVALVVEQLGRQTCLTPFLGQGVMAPELALLGGVPGTMLGQIINGSSRITLGLTPDLSGIGRWGEESIAWDARGADHALLLGVDDRLMLVPLVDKVLPQADVTRVLFRVDPDSPGRPIGQPIGAEHLQRAQAFMTAMISAELVGVMQGSLNVAIRHVRTRKQFGVPIGTFQAVQHLLADALVLLEGSRSAAWFAAWAADELDPEEAALAAHQAKAYASTAALTVVETETQLLGGIAITWEESTHLRLRRVLLDRLLLGDRDSHLDAIAQARVPSVA